VKAAHPPLCAPHPKGRDRDRDREGYGTEWGGEGREGCRAERKMQPVE